MNKLLLILLFIPNIIFCQDSADRTIKLIGSLSTYRSNLLSQNNIALHDLKKLIDKWNNLEPDEETVEDFIFQAHYVYSIKNFSFKGIVKYTKKRFPSSPLPDSLNEVDLIILANHSELVDLITNDVLSSDFPFKIEIKQYTLEEFEFYNFTKGESIAEIGAGKGTFSFLIATLDLEQNIFINELDKDLVAYIDLKKKNNHFQIDQNSLQIIKGSKTEINIPEKADKIIIRNSLHHFSKKSKMLDSIRKSLKDRGSIFIHEYAKDNSNPNYCNKRMNEMEIKKLMLENGFKLRNEKKIGKLILLEYGIQNEE